jgi:hypothetical protein
MVGHPPHEPNDGNRAIVAELAAYGTTQEKIASYLKICVETLVKHYRDELDNGKTQVIKEVAKGLVAKAKDGDLVATMFYLKTQGRWREKDPEIDPTNRALSLAEQILAHKKDQQKESV